MATASPDDSNTRASWVRGTYCRASTGSTTSAGTTPGPGGNFVEGRYGLTLGVAANLRAKWEIDMSWTKFGGAGRFNDLNDRDFVAATLKFSF